MADIDNVELACPVCEGEMTIGTVQAPQLELIMRTWNELHGAHTPEQVKAYREHDLAQQREYRKDIDKEDD